MSDIKAIPTGELFADLQVSYTEVVIIDLLEKKVGTSHEQRERRDINNNIIEAITKELDRRFTVYDLTNFLKKGFPRQVKLNQRTPIIEVEGNS
jgi:hypothetical protein